MTKRPAPQKQDQKLLDIVIPVYGRFDLLKKCLSAIPDAVGAVDYNLILVDNNSPDQDEARLFYIGHEKDCIIIHNKENVGFPKSCNQGARRKTSPLILLLNSDVILQSNAINYMVMGLDDPKVGVVGAKLLFPTVEQTADARIDPRIRPSGKVQHVGMETNIRGEFYHIFMEWSPDNPKVNQMRETYVVTGACLLTRRSLWTKIGGFFEGYGQGTYEDVEYCLSVRKLGLNVIVEPKAVGVHYVGATAEAYKLAMPLNMNRLIFMQRWGNQLNYTESDRL